MISSAQSRAARALLNWSQPQLAEASAVSVSTIRDFETGKRSPIQNNLAAVRAALEAAGVIFVEENGEGPGVRLRKTRAFVSPVKDGTYEVKVAIAGRAMPHSLPNEFRSEEEAQAWIDGADGRAVLQRVAAKYREAKDG